MNKSTLTKIEELINEILPEITSIRHHIHKNPEIGLKEFETSKYIREKLKPLNLEILDPFMETDIVAFLNKSKTGKNITLRADIDALPLEEKTGLPYKSQNDGFMHACGHDGHTAMLIGAAIVLEKIKDKLNGSVRFVFQPGEEEVAGGKILVDKGALENPKPDAVLALHGWNGVDEGIFSSKPGAFTSAGDFFKITINGKGGHGASPELTIDPILTIAKIIDSINHITSRKINALDSAVISICHVESGKSSNIIPDSAMIEGTVRFFDPEVGKNIPNLIKQTVKGICDSVGADFEFIYKSPYIPMIIDENIFNFSKNLISEIYGKDKWINLKNPKMGAEDFAYFIKDYPGAMLSLGLGEGHPALHNPHFDFNDKVLKNGIMFFVAATLKFLN
jgi:amidohydrolase